MSETGQIVLPVGIDDRMNGRQLGIGLMVIDHDDVGLEPARDGERLEARRSAVDRDDKLGAFLDERLDGPGEPRLPGVAYAPVTISLLPGPVSSMLTILRPSVAGATSRFVPRSPPDCAPQLDHSGSAESRSPQPAP